MSTRSVPPSHAKTITTCDRCRCEGERFKDEPFVAGGLHVMLVRNFATDKPESRAVIDLCDSCVAAFDAWELRSSGEDYYLGAAAMWRCRYQNAAHDARTLRVELEQAHGKLQRIGGLLDGYDCYCDHPIYAGGRCLACRLAAVLEER